MPIVIAFEKAFDPDKLRKKPLEYWLRAVFVTLIGIVVVKLMGDVSWWQRVRYGGYGVLERFGRDPSTPAHTAVVLIDDEDYWKGEFARRTPLRRDVLAKLIAKLVEHEAGVIALDIDLRAQTPDGSLRSHPIYDDETKVLFGTIDRSPVPIVLLKTVTRLGDGFHAEADLHDGDGSPHVTSGYVLVPRDIRQVPLHLETVDNRRFESFSMAVAQAMNEDRVRDVEGVRGDSLPFGRFYSADAYAPYTFTVREIMSASPGLLPLKGRAVIVGGVWHRGAFGRGARIDTHFTPVGELPGALLHANYVETILEGRGRPPVSHWLEMSVELLFAALLAVIFVAGVGHWKFTLLAISGALALLASVVFWQNFGVFLDGIPLVILLGAHAAVEQIIHWRDVAVKCTEH